MWQTSATVILPIIAGYLLPKFDPLSRFLSQYIHEEWQSQVLISSILLLCALVPYRLSLSSRTNDQKVAARNLLLSTKEILKKTISQGGVNLEQISNFNKEFEETKYFLKKKQKIFVSNIIVILHDIHTYSSEREGILPQEKRKKFVQKERSLLDKVECSIVTIEIYIQEYT